MTSPFSFDVAPGAMAAILVAAAVSYVCRASGFWMMGFVKPGPRLERALAALPGSIVVAIVLPAIARTGPVAAFAIVVAVAMKVWRKNDILALLSGLSVTILMRGVPGLL